MAFKIKVVDSIAHDHSRSRRKDAFDLASGKKTVQEVQASNALLTGKVDIMPGSLWQSLSVRHSQRKNW